MPAERNLIDEVRSVLMEEGVALSGSIVVFPGRRPAHFLRRSIALKRGRGYIPPRIFSMDDFIDYIYEDALALSNRKLTGIDAVSVLYDIHGRSENRLGGRAFLSPEAFLPFGSRIFRDLEEFRIEGIAPERVRMIDQLAEDMIPRQSLERLQSLSALYHEFYRELEGMNLSTRSMRYGTVAERLTPSTLARSRIVFAGFYALTRSEKEIFRSLSKGEETVFIFQAGRGIVDRVRELGLKADHGADQSGTPPRISFYKSPDTHGQVFALSRILKDIRTGTGADNVLQDTAIVLPASETLFPLLHHCLCLFDEKEYNITMGYPIRRTPIYGFFNLLMELVSSMDEGRIYLPDYLNFVLHPYTKNIYFKAGDADAPLHRADITRIIFHKAEEYLKGHRKDPFIRLEDIEEDGRLIEGIIEASSGINGTGGGDSGGMLPDEGDIRDHIREIHDRTIRLFSGFSDMGDLTERAMQILSYIYENSTARYHPFFHPFSEALMKALIELSESMFSRVSFNGINGYFTFFRRYVSTVKTPFEGTPLRGLQVMGMLETRGLRFRNLFILDLNEGIVPDTGTEDSILPHKARVILGLPTYRDREQLISYYLSTLIEGAEEAHLFYIENDRKEKSRFVERLLWERQKEHKTRDSGKLINTIQYRIGLKNREPLPVEKTDEVVSFLKNYEFSATSLDDYLRCHLRFYYSEIMGMKKRSASTVDIDRYEIGNIVHRILASCLGRLKGGPLTRDGLNSGLAETVTEEYFRHNYTTPVKGRLLLIKKQISNRISDLIKKYYLPMAEEETLIIRGTELRIRHTVNSFRLKGRIDSLEDRGNRTCIVDFKTSSSPAPLKINFKKITIEDREHWPEHIGSLQMPFYLLLYKEKTGIPLSGLEGLYLLLGRKAMGGDIELPFFEPGEGRDERFSLLYRIIFSILDEISQINVPFTPTKDFKRNCPGCMYSYICGTQWIGGREHY